MEGNPLWKKVICSIHSLEANMPLIQQQRVASQGGVWDKIMKVDRWGERYNKVIKQGWWMRVGDGIKTRFWSDKWIGDLAWKEKFLRLFLVSLQKEDVIANMDFLDGMFWQWNFTWSRNLFQWEA